MKRFILALLLAAISVPASANIRGPKGFDKKVYDATFALYASSKESKTDEPKHLCTVTAYQKFKDGYLLIGAGHCTQANTDLPDDFEFFVESDLDWEARPVQLIKAELVDNQTDDPFSGPVEIGRAWPTDYSIFYLKTKDKIQTIPLGDENSLQIGSRVLNVNFTNSQAKYIDRGVVSSDVRLTGQMYGFYSVDEFGSHGASGSSVVDLKTKKIVGLVIAGNDGETVGEWIEPISTITDRLKLLDYNKLIASPEIPKVSRSQDGPDDQCLECSF